MNGYVGKLLFVNLSTEEIEKRPLDENLARNYLGGPALGAKILYDEMPAHTHPFAPESVLGFVSGPYNSNGVFFGGRYTVVCKSPVYDGWNDANSGGEFGPLMKMAGYDAIFVKGIAEKPTYLYIKQGKVTFCDASDLWGLTVMETEQVLHARHGDHCGIALIGPAGENLSYFAGIMNDSHRGAARGGSGAVMGSKHLKAVVVDGFRKTKVADREAVIRLNRKVRFGIKYGMGKVVDLTMGNHGTGFGFQLSLKSGDCGVKNFTGAYLHDYTKQQADTVGIQTIDRYFKQKFRCSTCPIGCGAVLDIPSEKYDLHESARPEYETMGHFGALMLNGDYESVCRCNNLCNNYGFDTISAGATIAWAMECFEAGELTVGNLDGIELTWGNADAIVAIMEKIAFHEGVGRILTKGSRFASEHFGVGRERLMTASGIECAAHDPRLHYGLTRIYQYDPTPGRHTKGGLGSVQPGEKFDYEGSGSADVAAMCEKELIAASGFCSLGQRLLPKHWHEDMVNAVTGFGYSDEEYRKLCLRMYNMRHAFNQREGKERKDFTLADRETHAAPPFEGPLADAVIDVTRIADNFFDEIGWDKTSLRPSRESLELIGGMDEVIADLYGTPPAEQSA